MLKILWMPPSCCSIPLLLVQECIPLPSTFLTDIKLPWQEEGPWTAPQALIWVNLPGSRVLFLHISNYLASLTSSAWSQWGVVRRWVVGLLWFICGRHGARRASRWWSGGCTWSTVLSLAIHVSKIPIFHINGTVRATIPVLHQTICTGYGGYRFGDLLGSLSWTRMVLSQRLRRDPYHWCGLGTTCVFYLPHPTCIRCLHVAAVLVGLRDFTCCLGGGEEEDPHNNEWNGFSGKLWIRSLINALK